MGALIFLFMIPAFAADTILRVEDLPRLVRDHNENARGAELEHSAAKERTGYLRRSFLPRVSLRAGSETAKIGATPSDELGFWSAEAKVNVFSGGRDKIEEQILAARARTSGTEAIRDYNVELREARRVYWHLAATQLLIADAKEAIERNEENIKGAKQRAGAGVTTAADYVHFELEKTVLVKNLKRLEHEDDVLKSKLSVLIGFSDHKQLKIQNDFPHPPEAEFQERELKASSNPEVLLLRESETVGRLRARQAARWYLPKLDLYAKYSLPSLSEDRTLALRKETELITGVSLTLDLTQGFNDRANQHAQNFEAQAQAARARHKVKAVQSDSHELQHDLRMLHELLHDADRDVQKAQNFLRLTKSEYARGVKNGPDLLEAFLKLYEFRKRKIELNLEYQLAKAELEALSAKGFDSADDNS